jgi:hypothetical protein
VLQAFKRPGVGFMVVRLEIPEEESIENILKAKDRRALALEI